MTSQLESQTARLAELDKEREGASVTMEDQKIAIADLEAKVWARVVLLSEMGIPFCNTCVDLILGPILYLPTGIHG